MIAVVVVGLVALAVLAVVVGVVDSASTGTWRAIARERRATWEERQRERRLADIRDQHRIT
jgi:hypothetical protein